MNEIGISKSRGQYQSPRGLFREYLTKKNGIVKRHFEKIWGFSRDLFQNVEDNSIVQALRMFTCDVSDVLHEQHESVLIPQFPDKKVPT